MEWFRVAGRDEGLTDAEIRETMERALEGRTLNRVLIIPPDFTRFHSKAGFITQVCYRMLTAKGVKVDVLPALGTHAPVSREQAADMFGDIPFEKLLVHNWRTDVVKIGEIPASFVSEVSEGLWNEPLSVEINRRVMDPAYDLILSPGQVVPHEVIGMANHAKNLFVGVGAAR